MFKLNILSIGISTHWHVCGCKDCLTCNYSELSLRGLKGWGTKHSLQSLERTFKTSENTTGLINRFYLFCGLKLSLNMLNYTIQKKKKKRFQSKPKSFLHFFFCTGDLILYCNIKNNFSISEEPYSKNGSCRGFLGRLSFLESEESLLRSLFVTM